MADRTTIRIRGLEVFGHHGVYEEERTLGQRFLVDLDLELTHCPAVHDDDLAGTVDYAAIAATIAELVAGRPSRLLEHLAGRIADAVLEVPLAQAVTVTIDKPHVALAQRVASTGVRLHRRRRHTYWVGLGGNLGDRLSALQQMTEAIARRGVRVEAASPVYETDPQLVVEQPAFLNAVLRVTTTHPPPRLLSVLKQLERRLGREQDTTRFGPRVIDADILLWDGGHWGDERLVIPHPRLAERRFAMVPLLDLDPRITFPDGSLIAAHEERLAGGEQEVSGFGGSLVVPGADGDTSGGEQTSSEP